MEDNRTYGITEQEKHAASHCLEYAMAKGASQARISLSKSVLDSFQLLNGELDKVSHCADRSIFIYLFADGRYGTFSTNRIEIAELEKFIDKALESTKMFAIDRFRKLPDPERTEKNALTGREAGLYDAHYEQMTARRRLTLALEGSVFKTARKDERYELISEECEYSDSIEDNYVIDSNGFEGRHTETSFSFWTEVTIVCPDGHKYSGYSWTSSPRFDRLEIGRCGKESIEKAAMQIDPKPVESGKRTMVVDNLCSSRLFAPILSALNASAIQQHNSFLEDSLGKQTFNENLTVTDLARTVGEPGARLFDTEGTATRNLEIIGCGKVRTYFVNTYMSGKIGMEPTIEGISRPVLRPFLTGCDKSDISAEDIISACSEGILVTGFNGGNCNTTTGNFSYGVEGFVFKNGKILHPVKEMVITGNMISLWNNLFAAGSDARYGARWQIPTLAFTNVDFSA